MLRGLKFLALLLVAVFATLLVPSVRESALPPLADWLDIDENAECAEYVMVLPGDEIRRGLTAAALVRIGLAHDVLIPQNPESADVRDGMILPTAQISREILQHRGISNDRIVLLESASRSTFDDASALNGFLRGRHARVTVVTSAFHTRRARFVFRKVFGTGARSIRFVSAPNPGFEADRWWESSEGVRLILTEYAKLGYYSLRYGDPRWWMVCGFLLALVGWKRRGKRLQSTASSAVHAKKIECADVAAGAFVSALFDVFPTELTDQVTSRTESVKHTDSVIETGIKHVILRGHLRVA